tara:strand:+ start:83 stop:754 length:672 start_codon:yes stop_codon:yes gene_type:complete
MNIKNITLILFIILVNKGCAPIEQIGPKLPGSKSTSNSEYDYNVRWIDNTNVMDLLNLTSENSKITYNDVYKTLGEPVYIEKLYIDNGNDETAKNTILFLYKYKSRLYPVAEQETITTEKSIRNEMGITQKITTKQTSEYSQIKPNKAQDHSKWEEKDKWLTVLLFDNTYELILSDNLGDLKGLYRDYYDLSSSGNFEPKRTSLLEQIETIVNDAISKLESNK